MAEIKRTYGEVDLEVAKRWFTDRDGDGPIWMINLMKYREVAAYDDPDAPKISGQAADDEYAPVDVLDRLGARVALLGQVERQLEGEPAWDRVAIVRYPDRMSFLTMEQRDDFKEKHVHKEAGMEFTIIVGGLPEGEAVAVPKGGSYVLRARRYAPGASAPADPGGVTKVAHFRSDGTIVGDGRSYDEVRFDVVDSDELIESLLSPEGVEEQVTLVIGRQIDVLVDTVHEVAGS